MPHRRRETLWMAFVLLIIAASRLVFAPWQTPDVDEVWSIWQTFGSPQQILSWLPYDWPPLYYLALGGWKEMAGITPFALRYLSLLAFLLGVALLSRAAMRMFGRRAGVPVAIAFGALGYNVYLSTLMRGYVLLLALAPLALWLTTRYFERPSARRALWLGVCMAVMFYTHLTSAVVYLLLGMYTLIVYRRAVWRWWLPGVIAGVLAAPEIASKVGVAVGRTAVTQTLQLPPLTEALADVFAAYAGYATPLIVLWAALFALATVSILVHFRERPARTLAIGSWLALIVAFYVLNPVLGFFNVRYLWWGVLGVAVWVGWGVARLPRLPRIVAVAAMLGSMFWPVPVDRYAIPTAPMMENFVWLQDHLRGGDVLLIDPNLGNVAPEEWDYFTRVYFPHGLAFVNDPAGYRRIWYASIDGRQDPATFRAVTEGRVPGMFVGPWNLLFRLYEAPPDPLGVSFENGMRFHGVDVLNGIAPTAPVFREGETIRLRLWWTADRVPDMDYSVGVYLMTADGETRLAQADGPLNLAAGALQTSQMAPGVIYQDERQVSIPYGTATGQYAIYITVYDSASNTRVEAPGVNEIMLLHVQPLSVKAW